MSSDNSLWAQIWSTAIDESKESLKDLPTVEDGVVFEGDFPPADFFELWKDIEKAPKNVKTAMLYLLPMMQYLQEFCTNSVSQLEGQVNLGVSWSLLAATLKEAIAEQSTILATPGPDPPPDGSLGDVKGVLEEFVQKVERFESHQGKQSKHFILAQKRIVEVHTLLLKLATSLYAWVKQSSGMEVIMMDKKEILGSMNELIGQLESLAWKDFSSGNQQGTKVQQMIEAGANLTDDIDAILPFHNIPSRPNPSFFGRENELHSISEYTKQNDKTVITIAINGLGGVGKTQIALHYAHSQIDKKYVHLVLWIHAETPETISEDLTKVACGLQLRGTQPGITRNNQILLFNWLRKSHVNWLMVFDNVDRPELVEQNWPPGAGTVLITARSVTVGQHLHCKQMEVQIFDLATARKLFLRLLKKEKLESQEDEAATEIVSELNGHALALHQMAAFILKRNVSISRFLEHYKTQPKRLHRSHGYTQGVGYNHFLDTVWAVSFGTINEKEKQNSRVLLGILSFLSPEDIPRELFHNERTLDISGRLEFCVTELDFEDAEEDLVSLALVKKDSDSNTFTIHRLVQNEFCYSIDSADRQNYFEDAVELLYRAFPQQIKGRLMHASWPVCSKYILHVLRLARRFDSVEKGMERLIPTSSFCKLLCSCAWYLSETGSDQLDDILGIAFRAYEECDETLRDPIDFAHLSNTRGVYFMDKGYFAEAEQHFTKCMNIRESALSPDDEELGNIFNNLGNLLYSRCKYDEALKSQLKAEIIRKKSCGEVINTSVGMSQLNIGRVLWRLGQRDEARRRLAVAQGAFLRDNNWYLLAQDEGNLEGAKKLYLEGKRYMVEIGKKETHPTTSTLWYKLGCVAYDGGEDDTAMEYLERAQLLSRLNKDAKGERARVAYMLGMAFGRRYGVSDKMNENLIEAKRLRSELEGEAYREENQSEQDYDKLSAAQKMPGYVENVAQELESLHYQYRQTVRGGNFFDPY
ncbi:hypothetical protein V8C40DRAFT_260266 [Trichoderma camerunense]